VYAEDWERAHGGDVPRRGLLERFCDESGTFDGVAVYGRKLSEWEESRFGLMYLGKIRKKP
jgi:hypothetical protein